MLFGYKPSKIEADSVMSSINPSTSGLSLEEFVNIVRKKKEAQLYRNEIRHIFTAFDVHYRGFLTLEDFQKAFRQVAPRLPERTVIEVFRLPDAWPLLPLSQMLAASYRSCSVLSPWLRVCIEAKHHFNDFLKLFHFVSSYITHIICSPQNTLYLDARDLQIGLHSLGSNPSPAPLPPYLPSISMHATQ
ncbi:uncharacterized protein [Dipodomys merriami]